MISSFSVLLIKIGTDNDFDFIVAAITEWMSMYGEIDVDPFLQFKNPLFQLLRRTLLFLFRLFDP